MNSNCSCNINLSMHDIIEIAFKPVIENITSIISSTLVNGRLFGKFHVKNLFILGDIFNICHESPLHQKMTRILQETADMSIEKKELGTYNFVMLKSIDCLFRPKIGDRHFLHESFHKGCLHQVSRENYGLDFYSTRTQEDLQVSYRDGVVENTIEANEIMVILQRGQLITNEGIAATFSIQLKNIRHRGQVYIRKVRNIKEEKKA